MTDEIIAFKGEIWLLSWRESHNNGATVTFQLADSDELASFKEMTVRKGRRAGQRFACVLVEINDDETPVVQEKKGGPLSKSAAMIGTNYAFQSFAIEQLCEAGCVWPVTATREELAREMIIRACGITSRADLDHNPEAAQKFHGLMSRFNSRAA